MDVEAKVIDADLATISKAEEWLAKASERVAERCELYKPPAQITTEAEFKDARSARAQCRKDAAEIDNERKAILRDMEDALKKFKSEVKDVLSPLTDLDARYKELLDSYDEMLRTQRVIELSEEYAGIAPDLVDVVPLERIIERFGNEKGKAWLNKSTNIMAVKGMLGEAIYQIADAERTLSEMADPADLEEVKAIYFDRLDLQAALSEARRRRDQRERVAELERVRREREAAYAQYVAESQPEVETVPQPVVETVPQEEAHAWVIVASSATRSQMMRLRDLARSEGIVFDCIYSGTLQEVYERVSDNA